MKTPEEIKRQIINAGHKAVKELIIVAEEKIITNSEDDLAADRLKSAAATKKLAIFDAFEILARIEAEKNMMNNSVVKTEQSFSGFAERRSK